MKEIDKNKIEVAVRMLLEALGDNTDREEIKEKTFTEGAENAKEELEKEKKNSNPVLKLC